MTVILSVGVFGNLNIILATLRKKHLKTKVHLLICLMALMDLISIAFELSSAVRMFRDEKEMPRKKCFGFLWVYLTVYDAQMVIGLAVAVDRFVAVSYPMRYLKLFSRIPTPLILLIACFLGAIPVFFAYLNLTDDIIPICNPPLVMPEKVYFYWNGMTMVLVLSIIVIYSAVFVVINRLEKTQKNIRQLKITKTLASMIIAYASTKVIAVITTFFVPLILKDHAFVEAIATYMVLFVSIEYGINYWLLLLRKDDTYRRPFMEQLGLGGWLKKHAWTSDSIQRHGLGSRHS
ncbi:hypothetical protein L596_016310 [Steinernema carpocapsae]|uniref:G-protein coupled receptors family 1 profile domain-containing protein n=1 Tax=Steinernema carpocapsae TaxID=34508 RepID=A0A4U5NHL6_STECR|nr:hypothetical protein L596_016310 [Steinernema carpocapsae]